MTSKENETEVHDPFDELEVIDDISIYDFEMLDLERKGRYGYMVHSKENPIMSPLKNFDPNAPNNGYDAGRYHEDLFFDLTKCQCTPPLTFLQFEQNAPKHKYVHAYDAKSGTWESCPNRLEIVFKNDKILYLAMTENGSMTDSIASIHNTKEQAVQAAKDIRSGKNEEWSWQLEEYEKEISRVYVVRYDNSAPINRKQK